MLIVVGVAIRKWVGQVTFYHYTAHIKKTDNNEQPKKLSEQGRVIFSFACAQCYPSLVAVLPMLPRHG